MKEKVVAMIEQHLDHDARVEHDVSLPVLTSRGGRKCQCDVVIYNGRAPRETLTIVEVQKRKGKPKINDFRGWLYKMREVGAQHLFCVSEVGFPKSIEEKSMEVGPTVRLLTLAELAKGLPPTHEVLPPTVTMVTYEKLDGIQIEYAHVVRVDGDRLEPDPHAKIFRLHRTQFLSPTDLLDSHLFGGEFPTSTLPEGTNTPHNVKFLFNQHECEHETLHHGWVQVTSLLLAFHISISRPRVDWRSSRYEQVGHGELGWVVRGVTGDGEVLLPFKFERPGLYTLGRPMSVGSKSAFFVSVNSRTHKAAPLNIDD